MSKTTQINTIIDKTKDHFLDLYAKSGSSHPYPDHVTKVAEIAESICNDFPTADREVVLLGVWLHDIGTFLGDRAIHEINSEKEARTFLASEHCSPKVIEKVAHCVRAHRCSDIQPSTTEAKILAVADSASHLVSGPYIQMSRKFGKESVMAKLERDYRDIGLIPRVRKELTPLYTAWKNLLILLPD